MNVTEFVSTPFVAIVAVVFLCFGENAHIARCHRDHLLLLLLLQSKCFVRCAAILHLNIRAHSFSFSVLRRVFSLPQLSMGFYWLWIVIFDHKKSTNFSSLDWNVWRVTDTKKSIRSMRVIRYALSVFFRPFVGFDSSSSSSSFLTCTENGKPFHTKSESNMPMYAFRCWPTTI